MNITSHKINLVGAMLTGVVIGINGWWIAAVALAIALAWRGE